MKSIVLKAAAAQWLRYERQCMIVTLERVPVPRWFGVPDVIGVSLKREITEIEVKVSTADFRNNTKKRCMKMRAIGDARCPHQFYFLVPRDLVAKVQDSLPTDAGLMTIGRNSAYSGIPQIEVVIKAPKQSAQVLSVREMAYIVKDQSGTLVSMLAKLAKQ